MIDIILFLKKCFAPRCVPGSDQEVPYAGGQAGRVRRRRSLRLLAY
jgi:hypothetical protein